MKAVMVFLFLSIAWNTAYATENFNPCRLLTTEEATHLAGEPVKNPELKDSNHPLGQKICFYDTRSSSRLIQISVIRTADIPAKLRKNGQSASSIYTSTKEMLAPVKQVMGLGDDAIWGTPGLHILAGEVYVLVSVGNTSKPENLELARRIAEKALPRL